MLTATTGEVHWRPDLTPPFPADEIVTKFDWSGRLSMDLVRAHTRTGDVPGVTEEQLNLYRAVAIEAAERYTGMLLEGQRTIHEPIQAPPTKTPWRPTYTFRLRYPVADGVVYMYGGPHPNDNRAFRVPPNTRKIQVPIRMGFIDTTNCCDPCATPYTLNRGMFIAYTAGFRCPDEVPAAVVLGCLQYVAWVVEHPGDEILTVRNRRDARSEGAMGTNNVAIASGALETWRLLDEDIV